MVRKLRSLLQEKPLAGGIAGGAILLTALTLVAMQMTGPARDPRRPPIKAMYFYDLQQKKLFAAPIDSAPPILAPGQAMGDAPAGVKALVFACGDCGDASKHFVGWLETTTPEAIAARKRMETQGPTPALRDIAAAGYMLRAENGDQWHWIMSPAANAIKAAVDEKCSPDRPARSCTPDQAPEAIDAAAN